MGNTTIKISSARDEIDTVEVGDPAWVGAVDVRDLEIADGVLNTCVLSEIHLFPDGRGDSEVPMAALLLDEEYHWARVDMLPTLRDALWMHESIMTQLDEIVRA